MSSVAAPPSRLVEREEEVERLRCVAAEAERGSARVVLVTGPAGSGKTRLATEVVEELTDPTRDRPWRRVEVVGSAAARSMAHLFSEALPIDAGTFAGTGVVGGDAAAEEGTPATALGRRLGRALEHLIDDRPLAFVIDDLQLLDPVAVDALHAALDQLHSRPLLVVATFRTGALAMGSRHARAVGTLAARPDCTEIPMAALTAVGIAAMSAWVGPGGGDGTTLDPDLVLARTDGNPFLVEALLRAGSEHGAVEDAVGAMLGGAAVGVRELAAVLGVAGGPVPPAILRHLDPDGAAARVLLDRGAAHVVGGSLELRHALIGETLRQQLDDRTRVAHHRLLAAHFEAAGHDHDAVAARHWADAGEPERAAPLALRAADRLAAAGRPSSALVLYELARKGRTATMPSEATILERAAAAAARAGEVTLAGLLSSSARRADQGPAARDRRTGDPDQRTVGTWGNPLFGRLVRARSSDGTADHARAAIEDTLVEARRLVAIGDLPAALALGSAAHDAAATADQWALAAEAALLMSYAGDPAAALPRLRRAEAAGRDAGDLGVVTMALTRQSRVHSAMGDLDAALAASNEANRVAHRTGVPELWFSIQAGTSSVHAQRGEMADAARLADELRSLQLPLADLFADADDWIIAVHSLDVAGAVEGCERVLTVARAYGDEYFLVPMLSLAARTALLEGDHLRTVALVDEALGLAWSPLHEQTVDLHLTLALAAHGLGDPASAGRAAQALDDLQRALPGPGITGAAELAQGVVHLLAGDVERARVSLVRAERRLRAASRHPAADDAARLLASVGAGATGRLDALDARQRQIAEAVAGGASNREVAERLHLSEKTVRNALSGVFRELGVRRRAELVAMVRGDADELGSDRSDAHGHAEPGGSDRTSSTTDREPADEPARQRRGGAEPADATLASRPRHPLGAPGLAELSVLDSLDPGARALAETLAVAPSPLPVAAAELLRGAGPLGTLVAGRAAAIERLDGTDRVVLGPELGEALRAAWDPVRQVDEQLSMAERLTGAILPPDATSPSLVAAAAAELWRAVGDLARAGEQHARAGDLSLGEGDGSRALASYEAAFAAWAQRGDAPGVSDAPPLADVVERAAVVAAQVDGEDGSAACRRVRAMAIAAGVGPGSSAIGRHPGLLEALAGRLVERPPSGHGAGGILDDWACRAEAAVAAAERGRPDGDDPDPGQSDPGHSDPDHLLLGALERLAATYPDPWLGVPVQLFRARLALRRGDALVAREALTTIDLGDTDLPPDWRDEAITSALRCERAGAPVVFAHRDGIVPAPAVGPDQRWHAAVRLLAAGDLEGAGEALAAAARSFESAGAPMRAIDAWCLLVATAPDDTASAAMARARELAGDHGLAGVDAALARAAAVAESGFEAPVPGLTRRESDVARGAAAGATNAEIAAALDLTPATVRNYLVTVFRKLDVDRRSQLGAAIASAEGG